MSERCPHCDCPNEHCACVLRERLRLAEREAREAQAEAYRYRRLFEFAAGTLNANRARLGRPRGEDERRLLAYVATVPGPLKGASDGWLDFLDAATLPQPSLFS